MDDTFFATGAFPLGCETLVAFGVEGSLAAFAAAAFFAGFEGGAGFSLATTAGFAADFLTGLLGDLAMAFIPSLFVWSVKLSC